MIKFIEIRYNVKGHYFSIKKTNAGKWRVTKRAYLTDATMPIEWPNDHKDFMTLLGAKIWTAKAVRKEGKEK
jgi:hypothetical protein